MFNRWIEDELLDVLDREGVGAIVFSPLAQGLLTDKYLDGIPEDSRVRRGAYFDESLLTEENVERARALNEIARERGQSLAQLAIAWALRDPRSRACCSAPRVSNSSSRTSPRSERAEFDPGELEQIDRHAVDGGVNLWEPSSSA